MTDKKVLVVESESTQKFCLLKLLANAGYVVSVASEINEAVQLSKSVNPDIMLIDAKLSDGDGFSLCQQMLKSHTTLSVVMLCDCSRPYEQEKARALGARACLAKPFSFARLNKVLFETIQ